MREVFVVSDNISSPLGFTTAENFAQLKKGSSGIRKHELPAMSEKPFYASLFANDEDLPGKNTDSFTRFERMIIASVSNALQETSLDATGKDTVFILSSTKGNISLLETETQTDALKEKI